MDLRSYMNKKITLYPVHYMCIYNYIYYNYFCMKMVFSFLEFFQNIHQNTAIVTYIFKKLFMRNTPEHASGALNRGGGVDGLQPPPPEFWMGGGVQHLSTSLILKKKLLGGGGRELAPHKLI